MNSFLWSQPCLHLFSIASSPFFFLGLACHHANPLSVDVLPLPPIFLCVWSTLRQHQYDIEWKINYLRTVYRRIPWELAIHIRTFTIPVFTYVNALSFTLLTSERSFLRLVCLSVLSVRSLAEHPLVAEWVAISSALYYPEDRAGVLFISVFSESTVALFAQ